jgi:hypothetical protein
MQGNYVSKKVRVSANDTTPDYLEQKVRADPESMDVNVMEEGGNEYLEIALRNSGSHRIGETYSWVQQAYDYLEENSTSYIVKARCILSGTNRMGLPKKILVSATQVSTGVGYLRLWDSSNGNTIAEKAITNLSFDVVDMGLLTNLPEEPAMLEVQMRSAGGKLRVSSIIVLY